MADFISDTSTAIFGVTGDDLWQAATTDWSLEADHGTLPVNLPCAAASVRQGWWAQSVNFLHASVRRVRPGPLLRSIPAITGRRRAGTVFIGASATKMIECSCGKRERGEIGGGARENACGEN
jgi:hypothetical protein